MQVLLIAPVYCGVMQRRMSARTVLIKSQEQQKRENKKVLISLVLSSSLTYILLLTLVC